MRVAYGTLIWYLDVAYGSKLLNLESLEEGLGRSRETDEENTQEQVRMPMTMDGNEDTQTRLEPHVTMYA